MPRRRKWKGSSTPTQAGLIGRVDSSIPGRPSNVPNPLHFAKARSGKAVKPPLEEIAVASYVRQSNYFYGRHPFEVSKGRDALTYAKYARHPIVKDALDRIVSGVFWPKMAISPANDYKENPESEEIDKEVIENIQQSIDELDNETFNNVLKSMLRNGMIYGYSVAEMVWEELDKGKWRLKAIKPKPSYNFSFEVEENDDLLSLIYEGTVEYIKGAKLDNFLIGTWPYLEHGNYYGTSILNEVMFELDQLEQLEKIRVKATSQAVLSKMVVHVADGFRSKEENAKNSNEIKSFGSDADLIQVMAGRNTDGDLQPAYKFEMLDNRLSVTSLDAFSNLISELKRDIKRAFGIPDNIGSTTTSNNSFAKDSAVEYDMFTATTSQGSQWVQSLVNRQVIPEIIKYNFPKLPANYKFPVWKVEEVEEQWQIDAVTYLTNAISAGIISADETFVRERLGFPSKEKAEVQATGAPELSLVGGSRVSA